MVNIIGEGFVVFDYIDFIHCVLLCLRCRFVSRTCAVDYHGVNIDNDECEYADDDYCASADRIDHVVKLGFFAQDIAADSNEHAERRQQYACGKSHGVGGDADIIRSVF